jgi:hypothetical protein
VASGGNPKVIMAGGQWPTFFEHIATASSLLMGRLAVCSWALHTAAASGGADAGDSWRQLR